MLLLPVRAQMNVRLPLSTLMQGVQRRRRLRRSGGLRLLFSPARQEGPDQQVVTKLGGGS